LGQFLHEKITASLRGKKKNGEQGVVLLATKKDPKADASSEDFSAIGGIPAHQGEETARKK